MSPAAKPSSRAPPRPLIQDMPWFVQDRIVKYAGTKTNLALRGLSRGFKKAVDKAPMFYEALEIQMKTNTFAVKITLKTDSTHQRKVVVKPCKSGFRLSNTSENWKGTVQEKDHLEGVVKTIMKTLGQPKIRIGKLVIDLMNGSEHSMSDGAIQKFSERKTSLLKHLSARLSQNHRKIIVGTLELKLSNGTENDVLCVLGHLKPTSLSNIHLNMSNQNDLCLKKVCELAQWKEARILKTEGFAMDLVPFSAWKHFEGIAIRLQNLDIELFEEMKKCYSNHPSLVYAWIQRPHDNGFLEAYCRDSAVNGAGNEDFVASKTVMFVRPGNLWFQQRE